MELLADRSRSEATAALAGTWLAFCLALCLALPQPPRLDHLAVGAAAGALVIVIGFAGTSRSRARHPHDAAQRSRLAALSLLAGAALGAVLLSVLVALAQAEPRLRARFAGRLAEPAWRPWALGFESSILEEVVFRLFAMSAIAWLVLRLTRRRRLATAIGLAASAALFALAHIPAWSAATPLSGSVVAGVLVLNGLASLLLGSIFWRWGLPYAILCHFAGDAVVQSLGPRFLA